jgi:nucleotide-binding universal stress UspA family protein
MFKNVLAPLDRSTRSEASIPWARLLAPEGRLTLLHVVEPIFTLDVHGGALVQNLMIEGTQYLVAKAKALDPEPETAVVMGPIAPSILQFADQTKADLIAVATQGRSGFARHILGGTSEKLLHGSDVPLLVVPSMEAKAVPEKIRRIAVPLDGSDLSETILPLVSGLAQEHGAELVLIHSVSASALNVSAEMDYRKKASFIKALEETLARQRETVTRHLSNIATGLRTQGIATSVSITEAVLPDAILSAADKAQADLIALSSHGYGAIRRALLGSVASKLVRRSALPLLIQRAAAAKKRAAAREHAAHGRRS